MKKTFKLAAVALAGGLALSACGSDTPSTPTTPAAAGSTSAPATSAAPTGESTAPTSGSAAAPGAGTGTGDPNLAAKISILAPSYTESSKADWENIIAGYNKLYPKVEVSLQIEAWDGFTEKVQARIQANDAPDILNDNNFAESAKASLLYPITEVMSPETFSSIVPALADNGKGADGTQWAAPDIASARILIYNTDLFTQAGVTAAPKTWDELLDAAKKIGALGNGIAGYGMPLGKEEAQVESSLWIWGNGGDWLTGDKLVANTPANIEAFDFMKKVIDEKGTQPNPGASNRQQVSDLFNQGKLGMFTTHPGLVAEMRTKFPDVKYELAPVPSKDGSTAVSLGVTDFILAFNNKDESRKAATKAFLDYFYSPDVYTTWAANTGLLPVTQGAIDKQTAAQPENAPFFEALPGVRYLPQGNPSWTALQDALQANAGQITTASGKDVLDGIQAQVEAAG